MVTGVYSFDNATMSVPTVTHWVLPFASSLSEPCQHALPRLGQDPALPNLQQLLQRLQPSSRLEGDEFDLTLPHEKWLARQMGWNPDQAPWALWWARQDGVVLDTDRPWGLMSPCHWLMGRDHLTLLDPQALALTATESRELLEAIRPLFESEGWKLAWGAPTRWYVSHESLRDLPTASLDRVIGRNPDLWLNDHPQARLLRRLQSEVQMLWYTHPINEAREAARQLPVNSIWLSGCGPYQAPAGDAPEMAMSLRGPLFDEDWSAWAAAWQALDAGPLRQMLDAARGGQAVSLTLCGERHAQAWHNAPRGLWARLTRGWRQPDVAAALSAL